MTLQKGDTLVVSYHTFNPYNGYNELAYGDKKNPAEPTELPAKLKYQVTQISRTYYALIQYPTPWNGTVLYVYHKNNYTANAKPGFDESIQHAAP